MRSCCSGLRAQCSSCFFVGVDGVDTGSCLLDMVNDFFPGASFAAPVPGTNDVESWDEESAVEVAGDADEEADDDENMDDAEKGDSEKACVDDFSCFTATNNDDEEGEKGVGVEAGCEKGKDADDDDPNKICPSLTRRFWSAASLLRLMRSCCSGLGADSWSRFLVGVDGIGRSVLRLAQRAARTFCAKSRHAPRLMTPLDSASSKSSSFRALRAKSSSRLCSFHASRTTFEMGLPR